MCHIVYDVAVAIRVMSVHRIDETLEIIMQIFTQAQNSHRLPIRHRC